MKASAPAIKYTWYRQAHLRQYKTMRYNIMDMAEAEKLKLQALAVIEKEMETPLILGGRSDRIRVRDEIAKEIPAIFPKVKRFLIPNGVNHNRNADHIEAALVIDMEYKFRDRYPEITLPDIWRALHTVLKYKIGGLERGYIALPIAE